MSDIRKDIPADEGTREPGHRHLPAMPATPAPMSAEQRLSNLTNALVEDILKAPDEDVLLDALADRFADLRAQLAAARKPPEEGAVARAIENMREACLCQHEDDGKLCVPCRTANVIVRQAAALAEAEEKIGRLEGRMCLICGAKEPCKETPEACTFDPSPIDAAKGFMERALAAEAKLETARREIEAQIITRGTLDDRDEAHNDAIRKAIRALQQKDTAE